MQRITYTWVRPGPWDGMILWFACGNSITLQVYGLCLLICLGVLITKLAVLGVTVGV